MGHGRGVVLNPLSEDGGKSIADSLDSVVTGVSAALDVD